MTRFIDAILQPALWFVADWSLRWAVLIGVVMLSLGLLRPRRAATRQLLCLAALVGGLLLPFTPRWGGRRLAKETAAPPQAKKLADDFGIELLSGRRQPPKHRQAQGADAPRSEADVPISAPPPAKSLGNRRLAVLALVWCWSLAVVFHLIRWLGGWWFLRRLRHGALTLTGPAADVFAACRAELGISDRVWLAAHPHVHSPILLGLFRPLILVPPNWFQLPPDVQRAGLLHELAHVRRRDQWLAPLLEMIRVAFFFHPPLRWLLVRLERERELLCDEMVVDRGIDRHDYARMLLDFARQSSRLTQPRLLSGSYLPIGRRRTVKVRIHHLLEDDMERWIRPLPARWAVILGAGLLVLMLGLASYRIVAEEPEKSAAPTEKARKASSKTPVAMKLKRETLRYGGKNFDQWRVELETELKPEIRADGLTALAAFGANGYGAEATRSILGLMKGYDRHSTDKKDQEVVEAAFAANAKIDADAVPVLLEGLRDGNRRVRRFAINCLLRSGNDLRATVPLLLKAARDEDKVVAGMALQTLVGVKDKPKNSLPVFFDCLKDEEGNVRFWSLRNVGEMRPEASKVMPALVAALKDSERHVRNEAIRIAGRYGAQAKPVVPALLELLEKPLFQDYLVEILDALAAMGPEAKEALPKLRELHEGPIADISHSSAYRRGTYGQFIAQTIKKIEGK